MKHKIVQSQHTSYSPDLPSCDFFLFPKLKICLKGKIWGYQNRYESIELHQIKRSFRGALTNENLTGVSVLNAKDYLEEN